MLSLHIVFTYVRNFYHLGCFNLFIFSHSYTSIHLVKS